MFSPVSRNHSSYRSCCFLFYGRSFSAGFYGVDLAAQVGVMCVRVLECGDVCAA